MNITASLLSLTTLAQTQYEPASNNVLISTPLLTFQHHCRHQSNKLYHVIPPLCLSVITSLNHSLLIMRCGSEGGRETSLELLLQLQVCHPGSLSHGRFFMVLIWASGQKVCKLWALSLAVTPTHHRTLWSKSMSSRVRVSMHKHTCACMFTPCNLDTVMTKVTPSSREAGNNFWPSVSSTNCPPYREALILKKKRNGQSLVRAETHSILTIQFKWLVKSAVDDQRNITRKRVFLLWIST